MSPRSLVERFYGEVWNRADAAVAHAILSPDFRFRVSLGPAPPFFTSIPRT